jgi:ferredoxin
MEECMKHRIIKINSDICNGCGLCIEACHEGAIGLRDGKAVLLREDYCDGLGNCLPACPAGAISFEDREAAGTGAGKASRGDKDGISRGSEAEAGNPADPAPSRLNQWPIQIKLAPVNAPYFEGADLLISADCCAYAYGNFHGDFMHNRITLIGCPKLDGTDYSEKLTEILGTNGIRSVTVTRIEVPCCGGIEGAAVRALTRCGKMIPRQIITITTRGERVEQ